MVGNLNITTNIIYYFTSTCFDSFTFFLHFSCMFPAFLLNNIMRSVIKNIVYAKKKYKNALQHQTLSLSQIYNWPSQSLRAFHPFKMNWVRL